MNMDYDLFMQQITTTARAEMEAAGYEQLRTPEEVEAAFARQGTTLVMVNSVCGCAGGIARPAATSCVHYDKRPDHLVTVLQDKIKKRQQLHATILVKIICRHHHLLFC